MTRSSSLAVIVALLAACTSPPADPPPQGAAAANAPIELGDDDIVLASALQPFDACDDLLAHLKAEARKIVGPYGLPGIGGDGPILMPRRDVFVTDALDASSAPARVNAPAPAAQSAGASAPGSAGAAPKAGEDFSGTNVQEEGVDEPDIVKTDGRIVITVTDRRLHIVDLARPDDIAGSLRLRGWNHELLLDGDRLLVLTRDDSGLRFGARALPKSGTWPGMGGETTVLTLVDISDPGDPTVESRLTLDGSYRSARMTDGVARVVLASQPTGLAFEYPETGGLRATRRAERENRAVIDQSTVDDWLPYYVLEETDRRLEETGEGTLLDCDSVSRPPTFSGLGLLSVLSIDLAGDLGPRGATAVLASGETVYASPDTLYVATNRWFDPAAMERDGMPASQDVRTEIHAFDITQDTAEYVVSGSVRGHLLNQFSMSEHNDDLRVATTDGEPWADPAAAGASESFVTVLRQRDGALRRVGQVGNLGRGERIYAVRFLGDVGYVVTFRQTDPLYTVDLSDPTAPRTTGELKIRGYSAYLHPVGDGLLLGVGQDATDTGQTLGTQVSLFDISDPAAPTRLAKATLQGSSSEAEWDHHAFLYWPPTKLAVIPFETYDFDPVKNVETFTSGARALEITTDDIREKGRLRHPTRSAWMPPIRRAMVVGDRLVTVSQRSLMVSDLDTLDREAFVRFGDGSPDR